MFEQPTANFSGSDQDLFSPEEVRQLMRAEVDRSRRYSYPLACMVVGVDRLEHLHDLYGVESKEEILSATIDLVIQTTRASDFLGCRLGDKLLVLFPHTPPQGAHILGERLLANARELSFQSDGRPMRITLSIGASHLEKLTGAEFETLVQASETGLAMAVSAGGDRFVEWEEVHSEVEEIRRVVEVVEAPSPPPAARPGPPPVVGAPREAPGFGPPKHSLADEAGEEGPEVEELIAKHNREVDILKRRIEKLTELLGMTEEELKRVLKMKAIDPGLASIYRSVQGLSADDDQVEVKKALMGAIFQANLELKSLREREGS